MADNKIKIPFPPIDEARKEASLQKIHREISHKSLPVPVSFPELLLDQMHYISLEYWVIQAFFLLAVVLFTTCFGTLIKDSASILPSACAISSGLGTGCCSGAFQKPLQAYGGAGTELLLQPWTDLVGKASFVCRT